MKIKKEKQGKSSWFSGMGWKAVFLKTGYWFPVLVL